MTEIKYEVLYDKNGMVAARPTDELATRPWGASERVYDATTVDMHTADTDYQVELAPDIWAWASDIDEALIEDAE